MNVVISGWIPFPYGTACSSRIRSIGRGLFENGCKVKVITTARIPYPGEGLVDGRASDFIWEGVRYCTTNCYEGQQRWRAGQLMLAQVKACLFIWRLMRNDKIDVLYLYSRSFLFMLPLFLLGKLYGRLIVADQVEWYPPEQFKYGVWNPFYWDDWMGRQLMLRGCGLVSAITRQNASYFDARGIPSYLMPSLFDFSVAAPAPPLPRSSTDPFTLLYAGNCKKDDGVDDLLAAVRKCIVEGHDVHLKILGCDGRTGRSVIYAGMIDSDEILSAAVEFVGRVPEGDYMRELCDCDCLVLPRPDTQTVRAAFPTRLPEFLSTARPVLTTNVPDVPLYLEAGQHAEVTAAGASGLASGIVALLSDPLRATRIGVEGRLHALTVFDYRKHTRALLDSMETVVSESQ